MAARACQQPVELASIAPRLGQAGLALVRYLPRPSGRATPSLVQAVPRALCPRCGRPEVGCYCEHLVTLQTRTRIVVLQHPRERDKPVGTARIAAQCLPEAEVFVGVDFGGRDDVRRALSDPRRPPIILYPSDGATDVQRDPPSGPVTLVVIDGTWHHARTMLRKNPFLQALPRYAFTPDKPSEYRIRREPQANYVSTIEALALTLSALEGDGEPARILAPFRAMVETQLAFAARSSGARRRARLRRPRSPSPRLPVELFSPGVVCISVEANAWPYDRATGVARHPEELVYLSAIRLASGERFEAFVRPAQPLAPSPIVHARLPEASIGSGLARELFKDALHAFLRPQDVLCAWGSYGVNLLRDEGVALPDAIVDLRKVVGDVLKRKPGSIEALIEARALAFEALGEGRGGERLGMLVAVVDDLVSHARASAVAPAGALALPLRSALSARTALRPEGAVGYSAPPSQEMRVTSDPVEFLSKILPEVFNAAAGDMRDAAQKGDADAKRRHEELLSAEGALRVVLEGDDEADLYLTVQKGEMKALNKKPAVPVIAAFALPFEAVELGLEEMGAEVEKALPKLRKRLSRLSAGKAKVMTDQLGKERLLFHHVLKDTPDFDEVRVKIAIGGDEPPEKPTFTVTLDYDTFEDLRTKKLKPQAIMSKLQLSGDATRAMQLGMELMQKLSR